MPNVFKKIGQGTRNIVGGAYDAVTELPELAGQGISRLVKEGAIGLGADRKKAEALRKSFVDEMASNKGVTSLKADPNSIAYKTSKTMGDVAMIMTPSSIPGVLKAGGKVIFKPTIKAVAKKGIWNGVKKYGLDIAFVGDTVNDYRKAIAGGIPLYSTPGQNDLVTTKYTKQENVTLNQPPKESKGQEIYTLEGGKKFFVNEKGFLSYID